MAATPRRDRRRLAILLTAAGVIVGGWLLGPERAPGAAPAEALPAPAAAMPHQAEVRRRFREGVVMLHARQYEHAATALHRVLALAPALPEAHVNMGYALLGLGRHREARDFFESATVLRSDQANAYYGLGVALDALGDRAGAVGAMRTYLHLARDEKPEHLSRARAALWEWQAAAAKR
jgi:Flp pilus assembly protein TadD